MRSSLGILVSGKAWEWGSCERSPISSFTDVVSLSIGFPTADPRLVSSSPMTILNAFLPPLSHKPR